METGERSLGREWLLPTVIGLVPVGFVLWATRNGIGMSPDSHSYMSPVLGGEWDSRFPPGLPLILFAVGAGFAAVLLNSAALWMNLMASYALAVEVSGSRAVGLGVVVWLAASVATTQIHSMLWTEPLFCAAINVALLLLVKTVKARRMSPATLAALVLVANTAGAVRWAGVFLLPVIAGTMLAVAPGRWLTRLAKAAGVVAACMVSLAAGWVRNVVAGEPPMGPRPPSNLTPAEVLIEVPRSAAGYVQNSLWWASPALGVLLLLAALALVGVWAARTPLRWHPAVPVLAWIACYIVSLLGSSVTTRINEFGFRLSAPVLSSVIVVLAIAAARVLPRPLVVRVGVVSASWLLLTTVGWLAFAAGTPSQPVIW